MKIKLYPYNTASASAIALRNALRAESKDSLIINENSPRTRPRNDVVINWGNSTAPVGFSWMSHDLNPPSAVAIAANKLHTFNNLLYEDVCVPPFTEDIELANIWVDEGGTVVVRHRLNGHSGVGIELVTHESLHEEDGLPDARLYVLYKKKRSEYRVHVFKNEVIDVQEKRKEREFDRSNLQSKIRSRSNGWVFCRDNIVEPSELRAVARQSITALGLDFGAADIIYNQREDKCYVLEVNTAVGLEGTTVGIYRDAINNYVRMIS